MVEAKRTILNSSSFDNETEYESRNRTFMTLQAQSVNVAAIKDLFSSNKDDSISK